MSETSQTDRAASPRRALVTGAASELGREIVLALARNGYDVAFTHHKTALPDELMSHPGLAAVKTVPIEMELLSQSSIDEGFDAAVEGLCGLDLLVNNAARPLLKQAVDVTWEEWDAVLDVNLKAAYFLATRLARHCIERGQPGSVVNLASTHGMTGFAGRTVYGISKGGMIQMARMLAIEWAEAGVRVNTVAPSTVLTNSRRAMYDQHPGMQESMRERIPMHRFIEGSEVAAAVCYLVVDGGLTAV